ncbi:MAG: IPT/TIG domain-containing protein [archaeon]
MRRNLLIVLVTVATLLAISGCENDYPPSPWNPIDPGKPNGVITSISPADTAFEGVGIIEITGQNFSSVADENIVFFNAERGIVLNATPTLLTVQTPIVTTIPTQNWLDSIKIKLAPQGVYEFGEYLNPDSTYHPYRLKKAAIEYGSYDASDKPHALDCDSTGALYVVGESKIIYKIVPNGVYGFTKTTYCSNTGFAIITGLKIGPGGRLFYLRKEKNIYVVPAGGGAKSEFIKVSSKVIDLDFDQNGTLFAAGIDSIYAVNTNGTPRSKGVAEYKDFTIVSVRVYDNYVYVAGTYKGTDPVIAKKGIWRNAILNTTGALGLRDEVYDWTDYVGVNGPDIQSITFDEDGDLYIGAKESYVTVGSASNYVKTTAISILQKDTQTIEPLYDLILSPPVTYMSWNNQNYIYLVRLTDLETATGAPKIRILRVDVNKRGAPYYGRQL